MENKRRLKIVHIPPFYEPVIGGVETLVKNICELLAAKGHEVDILTCDIDHWGKPTQTQKIETVNGVYIYRFRAWWRIGFMVFFPGFLAHLFRKKYDIIHLHSFRHNHTDLGALVGRLRKTTAILHGHGPFFEYRLSKHKFLYYALYDLLARFTIFKSVSAIFAFTELEKKEYLKRGAPAEKITVIPNGIPQVFFEPHDPAEFLQKFGLAGKKIVLSVGRLHSNKRVDLLIRAFAGVVQNEPEARLVIVGPDGGTLDELMGLVRELGLDRHVCWLGQIAAQDAEMLFKAYASAICFVLASDYEPFGLVVLEAMAAGKPVIAVNAGGPSEIIDDGVSGFLIERGNVDQLRAKLLLLLSNAELARSIGEEAKRRAEDFKIDRIVDRIEENYFRLAAPSCEKERGAPEQSYPWLRPFLPKRLQPWLRGMRKKWQLRSLNIKEPFKTVFPYTQVSLPRQENLVRLCGFIEEQKVPGAIVECGVLDGGTSALMAHATRTSARPVHLFDAWEGLPESVEQDGEAGRKWVGQVVGSPRRAKEILSKLSIDPTRIHIHRGWFHDTFPAAAIDKIALLHIDCDFYEPTALCLRRWYPHVASGAYIQFDDYMSFQGCTRAVDEFLENNPSLRLETFGRPELGQAFFIRKP